MKLFRNLYALRTVGHALVAADAVVSLAHFRYGAVVADKVGASCTAVFLVLPVVRHITLVEAFVVVMEYRGDVNAVRTGHAVVALVARNAVQARYGVGNILEE